MRLNLVSTNSVVFNCVYRTSDARSYYGIVDQTVYESVI